MEHEELSGKIIGCAYQVGRQLGYGFLESVYQKCMEIELRRLGLNFESQKPITVYYCDEVVGEFMADLFVEGLIIVELKAVRTLVPSHETHTVNYLKATRTDFGLLINFGETGVDIKRKFRQSKRSGQAPKSNRS